MSDLVAVTSVSQVMNGQIVDRTTMVPMLKRAAILCDHIYFDTLGLGPTGGDMERLGVETAFGGRAEGIELLESREFNKLLLRPQDFGDASSAIGTAALAEDGPGPYGEAALAYVNDVPDQDLASLARPWRGVDYKTRGAYYIEVLADLNRPFALRPWIDEPIGLLAPTHREVLRLAMAKESTPIDMLQELAVETFFDFGSLSWTEVLKLRRSARIHDFRLALKKLEDSPPGEIRAAWRREVEALAESTMQNPLTSLIGGVLGNLPVGDLNPFGAATSIMDYFRNDERNRRFGWVYFVMHARRRNQPSQS